MIRYVAFACVLPSLLCAPEAKPPETPAPPAAAAEPAQQQAVCGRCEIPAPAGEITLTTPLNGARVTSPLNVEWRWDQQLDVRGRIPTELAIDGEVISQALRRAAGAGQLDQSRPGAFQGDAHV